jgi:hypothetical protein
LPPVSTKPAVNFANGTDGVVDTGGKKWETISLEGKTVSIC